MTKPNRKARTVEDLFHQAIVHVLTEHGLKRPPGSTDEDAWRDLEDVGRRLATPRRPNESLHYYARRLKAVLARMHPHQYVDGGLVAALQNIVDLYLQEDAQ